MVFVLKSYFNYIVNSFNKFFYFNETVVLLFELVSKLFAEEKWKLRQAEALGFVQKNV